MKWNTQLMTYRKILEFKSWSNKEKEDELLRIDCAMYTYLGTDSTKQDREQVKKTHEQFIVL